MTVSITRNGHNRYGVTLDDRSVILSVGETIGGVELIEFGDIHGILVHTDSGLFASDIDGSGGYRLYKVEDQHGTILHV